MFKILFYFKWVADWPTGVLNKSRFITFEIIAEIEWKQLFVLVGVQVQIDAVFASMTAVVNCMLG